MAADRFDRTGAHRRAQRVRDGVLSISDVLDTLVEIQERQDWLALDYKSWEEYYEGEFGAARLKLTSEQRGQVVAVLAASGMSKRKVAKALGVSEGTVRNDLKGRANGAKGAQNYALPSGDAQVNRAAETAAAANTAHRSGSNTADEPLVSSDGDQATTSTPPPPAAGTGAPSEADRPVPAVNPTDHQPAAGEPPVPDEGSNTGDETDSGKSSQGPDDVDREQERAGVSAPAPTQPAELIEWFADRFEDLDHDVLGPMLTAAELVRIHKAVGRLKRVAELLETWNERAQK